MAETEAKSVMVKVSWEVPPDIRPQYATNLVVVHDQHDFTITFFDVRPPVIVGTTAEKQAQLEAIAEMKAQCVAQIIVGGSRMEEFVQVLQDNLKTFRAKRDRNEKSATKETVQ